MEDSDDAAGDEVEMRTEARAAKHLLASNVDAPRRARRLAAKIAGGMPGDLRERAVLVTSELVANAVRHGSSKGGTVSLDLYAVGDELTVIVAEDAGGESPPPGLSDGYGLMILRRLADRWRIERRPRWRVSATFLPRSSTTSRCCA